MFRDIMVAHGEDFLLYFVY